jgi:hypothetical protein
MLFLAGNIDTDEINRQYKTYNVIAESVDNVSINIYHVELYIWIDVCAKYVYF